MIFCSGLPLRAELADGILAIVNNSVITREQVADYVAPAIDALRQQYASPADVSGDFGTKSFGRVQRRSGTIDRTPVDPA